jgi:hypothetical protein
LSPATSRPEAASTSVPPSGTDWPSTTSTWAFCSSSNADRAATVPITSPSAATLSPKP